MKLRFSAGVTYFQRRKVWAVSDSRSFVYQDGIHYDYSYIDYHKHPMGFRFAGIPITFGKNRRCIITRMMGV